MANRKNNTKRVRDAGNDRPVKECDDQERIEQRRLMGEWLNKIDKDIDRTPLWCYERFKRVFR